MSNVVYRGTRFTIEFAVLVDGSQPAAVFVQALDRQFQARLNVLFERLGESGQIHNREQFKKANTDFWEFKAFQARVLCYFRSDRRVVLTHGFLMKKDKMDKQELARAASIKNEYEQVLKTREAK